MATRSNSGRRRLAAVAALAVALMTAAVLPARGETTTAAPSDGTRPRIGLVLGGGGARGAAHVGVLRALEELRIPVDCVAGTSMGALVGGAYASGMTADEIERLVASIDWSSAFGSATSRDLQPIHVKSSQRSYSNSLEFGFTGRRLVAPAGLLGTQQVDSLLRSVAARARRVESFDHLPIPFRAVATDIRTGELALLDRGDLFSAMRASMAVPGVFTPVRLDGRVLVDGGLVRNLPVDVARQLCADVVVASSLASEEPEVEQLDSVVAVLGQTLDVLIKQNEKAQLATLGPRDVPIIIHIAGMTSADFDKVPIAMPTGYRAALGAAAPLAGYSLSPEQYAAWRASLVGQRVAMPSTIAEVHVAATKVANVDVLRRQVRVRPGDPLDEVRIAVDAQRLYALGDFESVDYEIRHGAQGAIVDFRPVEKPWGRDTLRFDVGLVTNAGGDNGFVLRADHTRRWVNGYGATWRNGVQVGREALLETHFLQPLGLDQRWFLEPSLAVRRSLDDVYAGDDRVARYEERSSLASLDLGRVLGPSVEWRLGVRASHTAYTTDIGAELLPQSRAADSAGWSMRLLVDTRDSHTLPMRGTFLDLQYYSAEPAFGADTAYQRLELFGQHVVPLGQALLYLDAAGGTDFDTGMPPYELFTLGGAGQLAGYRDGELRGREYGYVRIGPSWKLRDLQALFDQAIYGGITLEAGNVFERADGSRAAGMVFGSSVFVVGRTPLGPLIVRLGWSEGGHVAAYLQLGRPLREH